MISAIFKKISLFLSFPFKLDGIHNASLSGLVQSQKSKANDNRCTMYLPCDLIKGHYDIQIHAIGGNSGLKSVRLQAIYLTSNDEIEGVRQRLTYLAEKDVYAGRFALDGAISGLVVVFFGLGNSTSTATIKLRRLNGLEYYVRQLFHQVRLDLKKNKPAEVVSRIAATILRKGPGALASQLRETDYNRFSIMNTYEQWIVRHDIMNEDGVSDLKERLQRLQNRPLISVLMPVYEPSGEHLRKAIESVTEQIYENWELCIADDASTVTETHEILQEYRNKYPRIKLVTRANNGHISRASNSALSLVDGDWVAMLDQDDALSANALAEVVLEIARYPESQIIYSDEDKFNQHGVRYAPHFKPDFSRELFRSQNYLNHLIVHRTENIKSVGGWRVGFEGSQDYDLTLRIFERIDERSIRHIPKVLYHWRATTGSTALSINEKSYAYAAGMRALEEHVERTKISAVLEQASDGPYYRLRHRLTESEPLVSIIIPTRDKVELLRNCISSIFSRTTYRNFEILVVDNGSVKEETISYLEEMQAYGKIGVISYDHPFNYSAINNFAVRHVEGDVLCLMNSDIEVINDDWLSEMVSWVCQEDIGCVGAKLYYPDNTIQHAGVILGVGGVAGHSHKYQDKDANGYFHRLKLVQNLSAVTGACMVVRREIYEKVGGLDEENLTVAFNDVDFCLKVRELGLSNVWTPYAELYHHESKSRGLDDDPEKIARFQNEISYMQRRWKLVPDPYYSVNLTLEREDFSIAD